MVCVWMRLCCGMQSAGERCVIDPGGCHTPAAVCMVLIWEVAMVSRPSRFIQAHHSTSILSPCLGDSASCFSTEMHPVTWWGRHLAFCHLWKDNSGINWNVKKYIDFWIIYHNNGQILQWNIIYALWTVDAQWVGRGGGSCGHVAVAVMKRTLAINLVILI